MEKSKNIEESTSNNSIHNRSIIYSRKNSGLDIIIKGIAYNRQEVYDSLELKTKLVEESPEFAEQLYYQWRESGETELGKLFAEKYNGHPEYGMSAFHIGNELGMQEMKRPSNSVLEDVEKFEDYGVFY